jgi:hypothetical protein
MVDLSGIMGNLGATASNAGNSLLGAVFWVVVLGAIGIVVIVAWYLSNEKKKWGQFEVEITRYDAFGKPHLIEDVGGIFTNSKTGSRTFQVKKYRASMDPNKVIFVQLEKFGEVPSAPGKKGKKRVYLKEIADGSLAFMRPRIEDKEFILEVTEEDKTSAREELRESKINYSVKNKWKEIAYPLILIGCAIVFLICVIYGVKGIKETTAQLAEVAKTWAEAKLLCAPNGTGVIR